MTMKKGQFITIEGSEGVGKSTNIAFIEQWLKDRQISYIKTREPGGTPFAEELRDLLLAVREEPVHETAELLLMFAARAQHLQTKILPALERGEWVICDRFTDSTYAYQGGGRGMDVSFIQQLEKSVQKSYQPDLTILLDIDVELGLQRARKRDELDRFEREKIDFFERVRSTFLQRANDDPQRFKVVNAAEPLEKVQQQIAIALEGFI